MEGNPAREAVLDQLLHAERSRIARELHDTVAQQIISIGMNLEWCRAQLPEGDPIHGRICASKELARSAIAQLRMAIFKLSPLSDGCAGLVGDLGDLATDFARVAQLSVRVRVRGERRDLPAEAEHALLRIAQEALFNVHKHAHARSVVVELHYRPESVRLLITDDGVGIGAAAPTPRTPGAHLGLRNMCARARELGGSCVIARGRRGRGTQVRVNLPIRALAGASADG